MSQNEARPGQPFDQRPLGATPTNELGWSPPTPPPQPIPAGPPPQLFPPMPPPAYVYSPKPAPKKVYSIQGPDAIWALVVIVLGFLAWNWIWPRSPEIIDPDLVWSMGFFPAIAVTVYFVLLLACSLIYFAWHKLTLSLPAVIGAVVILLATVPYAIYDTTPLHLLAGPALITAYVVWHGYAARTAVAPLGAMTAADIVNQGLVVPFSNAGSWFAAIGSLFRGRKKVVQVIIAALGLVIALPVIGLVLNLLMSADSRFNSWMSDVSTWVSGLDLWGNVWQFILGLPVGFYLFALLYGNAHRLGTEAITAKRAARWAEAPRRIAQIAIAAPVVILCLIYAVFFIAMGSYLFSGFMGHLPGDFTYAEYARQGFFELATVAGINLAVLAFAYLFMKRSQAGPTPCYPPAMRILGAVLSGLTILLIATAMSKMILYISQYGLSQLRVYTFWFMAVLLVIFTLLTVWHIRPFRAATGIIVVALVSFLGLTWANTDAVIADYNVDHYLSGATTVIDPDYIAANLSDGAIPALVRLRDQAPDPVVHAQAAEAIERRQRLGGPMTPPVAGPWMSWNWQSAQAGRLLGD